MTEREQELSALTRDYNNLTDTYRTLLSKKYEAAIARNLEAAQKGERFKLLRPAQVPASPSWPDPLVLLPGGLAAGHSAEEQVCRSQTEARLRRRRAAGTRQAV